MKNGAMTSTSRMFFQRPALKRDRVGQRVADEQREQGRGPGVDERADELRVSRSRDRVGVGREVPGERVALLQRARLQRLRAAGRPSAAAKKTSSQAMPGQQQQVGNLAARLRRRATGARVSPPGTCATVLMTRRRPAPARRPPARRRRSRPGARRGRRCARAPSSGRPSHRAGWIGAPSFCRTTVSSWPHGMRTRYWVETPM